MDDERRAEINAGCGCKVIPQRHFNTPTIARCPMHEHVADLMVGASIVCGMLEQPLEIDQAYFTEAWTYLAEAIDLCGGLTTLRTKDDENGNDEIPASGDPGLQPALGDTTGDVFDNPGVDAFPSRG